MSLDQLLTSEVFAVLLVFCRLGSALMLMPGFGEMYVPMRLRLLLAIFFSIVLFPTLTLPEVPTTVFGLVNLLLAEIMVGIFLGGLGRMLIAALHMAGMIIAYQSNLASLIVQDVAQIQGQASGLGNFLSVSALVLLFVTDLHHLMLKSLVDSYTLFLPGTFPMVEDFSNHAASTLNRAFLIAMQLSAPHIVIGVILYLGAGIIARLMPGIQIFFLITAPQLLLSFFILMISFSAILMWYINYFRDTFATFVSP